MDNGSDIYVNYSLVHAPKVRIISINVNNVVIYESYEMMDSHSSPVTPNFIICQGLNVEQNEGSLLSYEYVPDVPNIDGTRWK